MNILIISSLPNQRRPLREILELAFPKVAVIEAGSGLEAFAQIKQHGTPGLAFVDYTLPPMLSGLETIERLNAIWPEIQVALVHGMSDLNEQDLLANYGIARIFELPLDYREIIDFVEKIMTNQQC